MVKSVFMRMLAAAAGDNCCLTCELCLLYVGYCCVNLVGVAYPQTQRSRQPL